MSISYTPDFEQLNGHDQTILDAPDWHNNTPIFDDSSLEAIQDSSFADYGQLTNGTQPTNGTHATSSPLASLTHDEQRDLFFKALWPNEQAHTYFCSFGRGRFVAWDVPTIASFINQRNNQDLYFGIGQTNKAMPNKRANRKIGEPDVISIAALFGDFDGQDFDPDIEDIKKLYKDENKLAKEEKRAPNYTNLPKIDPTLGKKGAFEAIKLAESKAGPASIIINSGGGYQAYWLLDKPIKIRQLLDTQDMRRYFEKWQVFIDGDKSAKDLERVYRVPYSYNCKPHYADGPLLATIVKMDTSIRYSISDINALIMAPQMDLSEQAPKAKTSKAKTKKSKVTKAAKTAKTPTIKPKTEQDHEQDITLALTYLNRLKPKRYDTYIDWFNVACALKHRFRDTTQAEKAFQLFDEWSKKSTSYDGTTACKKQWDAIAETTNSINFGSLAFWANEDDPNRTPLESLLEIAESTPNPDDLTDQLPDLIPFALKLTTTELTKFTRLLAKKNVKKGDIRQFRADLKEIRRETGKKTGEQLISGRIVKQGHEVMSELFELGYDFRMNQLDDSIEVNSERLTDGQIAEIEIKMDDLGFTSGQKVEKTYTAYAYQNSYHPIKDYLNSLVWDGHDHIEVLSTYLSSSIPEQAEHLFYNETFLDKTDGKLCTWHHAAFRRWLVGAVSKVFGASQNTMIVLDGPQGIGKSYLSQWLASPMSEYFLESAINTEDKDSLIRLAQNWIWEVAELGATTRKSDREALKSLLTLDKVVVRKAYSKTDMRKRALASFIGTINNEAGFLGDPTGNRRFLVVPLTGIAQEYSTLLNPHQIWAQAMSLYLDSGETGNLTTCERGIQTEINKAYTTQTASSDLLDDLYMITHDKDDKAPITEVLKVLQVDGFRGTSSQAKREIERWMTLNNIKKSKRSRFYGARKSCYIGIKIKDERCEICGKPKKLGGLLTMQGVRTCFDCKTT